VDEIVMLELPRAGMIPRARLTGMLVGMREVLPALEDRPVVYVDGDGQFETSWKAMRKHLRDTPAKRTLIGAINDTSALGALRAYQEAGRPDDCAIMGQNASPEGRDELRRSSRFIGSVAYFPEKYGSGLLKLALGILSFKATPPAVFVKHQLVTAKNVDQIYPNDRLTIRL
jgi:ribose transport system substrate-binding protein